MQSKLAVGDLQQSSIRGNLLKASPQKCSRSVHSRAIRVISTAEGRPHRPIGFLIDLDLSILITSSFNISYLCSNNSPYTDPLMVRAARGESIERPPCWYAHDHIFFYFISVSISCPRHSHQLTNNVLLYQTG
jgi:hypothetical protein